MPKFIHDIHLICAKNGEQKSYVGEIVLRDDIHLTKISLNENRGRLCYSDVSV